MTTADITMIPMRCAYYCQSCDLLHNVKGTCPNCANGNHSFPLASVLNRAQADAFADVRVVWRKGWTL